MQIGDFLSSERHSPDRCFYLQEPIFRPDTVSSLKPTTGLGEGMVRDLKGVNWQRIQQMIAHAGLGPYRLTQLFVGVPSTVGARSSLHYDHNDNIYLQISGTKRFTLFPPRDTPRLYAHPVHHELDRRSRLDLRLPSAQLLKRFPRHASATRYEVVLRPGEVLFLPAWWWHEVTTLECGSDGLCVSTNFWFDIFHRLTKPIALPLSEGVCVESARQLEVLLAIELSECGGPRAVPSFLKALRAQLQAMGDGACDPDSAWVAAAAHVGTREAAPRPPGSHPATRGLVTWHALHEHRPAHASPQLWEMLFEFVVFKLLLLVRGGRAKPEGHEALAWASQLVEM